MPKILNKKFGFAKATLVAANFRRFFDMGRRLSGVGEDGKRAEENIKHHAKWRGRHDKK
jgi:hypothetical protein